MPSSNPHLRLQIDNAVSLLLLAVFSYLSYGESLWMVIAFACVVVFHVVVAFVTGRKASTTDAPAEEIPPSADEIAHWNERREDRRKTGWGILVALVVIGAAVVIMGIAFKLLDDGLQGWKGVAMIAAGVLAIAQLAWRLKTGPKLLDRIFAKRG